MTLFRLFTDFDGRIGLRWFWFGSAMVALGLHGVALVAPLLVGRSAPTLVAFAGAFALFPWAALAAKRANDRGGSALFGILLVCAIVLPGQLEPVLAGVWMASLDTISLIAWIVALIDLGLMPGIAEPGEPVAARRGNAKAAA